MSRPVFRVNVFTGKTLEEASEHANDFLEAKKGMIVRFFEILEDKEGKNVKLAIITNHWE